jgi:hypothetical protein
MTKRREWQPYKVGKPSTRKNWTEPDCVPLDSVFHISHVSDAFRMFEDQKIRSTLVWDESKLKNTRTCVAWLSPNFWHQGSRYGNIRFDFDWKELIEGKKFYWVEAITHYSPPACRILIAKEEPSLELEQYVVDDEDGHLYHNSSNDTWYYNGKFTCEFMVDRDLPLSECTAVGFDKHHERFCAKDGSRCDDLSQPSDDAGAKLLARLIGQKVLRSKPSLQNLFLDRKTLHTEAGYAWRRILRVFSKVQTTGDLSHRDAPTGPIALAMLDRFGRGESIKELGSLFRSSEELELTLRYRAVTAFGIPLAKVPDSEDE